MKDPTRDSVVSALCLYSPCPVYSIPLYCQFLGRAIIASTSFISFPSTKSDDEHRIEHPSLYLKHQRLMNHSSGTQIVFNYVYLAGRKISLESKIFLHA